MWYMTREIHSLAWLTLAIHGSGTKAMVIKMVMMMMVMIDSSDDYNYDDD